MKQQNLPGFSSSADQDDSFFIDSDKSYEENEFVDIHLDEGHKITHTEFYDCLFKNCKFSHSSFLYCIFESCRFENCDLSLSALKSTSFRDVKFFDTKLTGVQWADATIPLDVGFYRCLLNYSGFIGVDLSNTEIIECQLKDADFSEANLSKARCSFSDFSGARFMNTNLTRADFTNATHYAIHPHGNKLCKTKFSSPDVLSLLDVFDIIIE
ncbi:MAG: pentapeptide repeat-containing protein [Proteobacteria bacterium]|nr:pentapeptide repeat-containing protein [Pseudomonadota bacterium]MBU1058417.1 pentapeptide repeat-containing protein [Pseudomonadota bacterium]